MEARWLGAAPKPGKGIVASSFSSAMVGGLALIGLALGTGRRPRGRVWAIIEGDCVTLQAVPENAGDPAFGRAIDHIARRVTTVLAES